MLNKALVLQLRHALRRSPDAQDQLNEILRNMTQRDIDTDESEFARAFFMNDIGPRQVGGTYWSGFWRESYVVVDVDVFSVDEPVDDPSVEVRTSWGWIMRQVWLGDGSWGNPEKPRISIHSTAWDWRQDKVISQPGDYGLAWQQEE